MISPGTMLQCKKRMILWPMEMLQKNIGTDEKTVIIHYNFANLGEIVMLLESIEDSDVGEHKSLIVFHPNYGTRILVDTMRAFTII